MAPPKNVTCMIVCYTDFIPDFGASYGVMEPNSGLEVPERSSFIRTVISSVPIEKFFGHRINLQNQAIASLFFGVCQCIFCFEAQSSASSLSPLPPYWRRPRNSRIWSEVDGANQCEAVGFCFRNKKGLIPSKYPKKKRTFMDICLKSLHSPPGNINSEV